MGDLEKTATKFFENPPTLDIDKIFSDLLFIRQIMETGNKNGSVKIDNLSKAKQIIDLFRSIKQIELEYPLIDSENGIYVISKDMDLNNISDDESLKEFKLAYTEDFEKFRLIFAKHNLISKEEADEQIKQYKDEYNEIFNNVKKLPTRTLTREQFVQINYDLICTFYLTFLKNEVYSQVFDMRKLQNIVSDLSKITDFAKKFPISKGILNGPDYIEFIKKARQCFRKSDHVLQKSLIFSEDNKNIFPLFVRLTIEGKDMVLLSHALILVIYIFLHSVLTKNLFDKETQKRAKQFEKHTQKKFEELGFTYLPNTKDNKNNPTLEIDGIAVKNNTCFVIECKNPRLPPNIESHNAKKILIDDLQGIVNGTKRTTRNRKRIIKTIPSLPQKIKFVQNNLKKLNLEQVNKDKIYGLIITGNVPIISEYEHFKIQELNLITNEILDKIIS